MPWVGTPEASQEPRPHGCCASAFLVGRAGRLLRYGSISGLFIPFTGVPACDLPVYASPGTLPYPTQDSVPDCWRGLVRVAISDDWTFCACKAQLPPHRAYGAVHGGSVDWVRVIHHPNRSIVSCRASREFIPDARVRHLAGCTLPAPRPVIPPVHRSGFRHARARLSVRRRRAQKRWPPSAAQTARAVFPHAAFTKIRLPWRPATVAVRSSSQGPLPVQLGFG